MGKITLRKKVLTKDSQGYDYDTACIKNNAAVNAQLAQLFYVFVRSANLTLFSLLFFISHRHLRSF